MPEVLEPVHHLPKPGWLLAESREHGQASSLVRQAHHPSSSHGLGLTDLQTGMFLRTFHEVDFNGCPVILVEKSLVREILVERPCPQTLKAEYSYISYWINCND